MGLSKGSFLKVLGTWVCFSLLLCNTAVADDCDAWVAKVVSVQGMVQAKKAGAAQWQPARLDDTFCPGDMLRVGYRSRAGVILSNESVMRLDQNTSVKFKGVEERKVSLIDILKGAAHVFSRVPRSLTVTTPFVNAAVEGTEFFIKVGDDQTLLSVFRGRVVAVNEAGSINLATGQAAMARAGTAPVSKLVINPRDAIQWAVYYPAVTDYRAGEFKGGEAAWQGKIRRSVRAYRRGDLVTAFSSLDTIDEDPRDPRFYTYRAGLLLTVGRVDAAVADIRQALDLDAENSNALALRVVMAVTRNRKDEALDLAEKAVARDPGASAARVALSYAKQAGFDVQGALESLKAAVRLSPENALAHARLSELWMSVGDLDKALETAQRATALNPGLARTQTVLGFVHLARIKTGDAKAAFQTAVSLDPAAPLPRLGLGLAKIREGDLKPGRAEIEIAAGLDPNNSLIRSYLGKAFFDEKRDKQSDSQLAIAKELDPKDPTPWFYDAIRKQTLNRPVVALQDLQHSIALNNNRAVYRSQLLLDEDLAARSAGLGRIYNDLGFEQLALVEGWKSVNIDPSNYSSHRLLADSYAAQPRHEIARVSELLQSQLLQPLNVTPVQPSLAEADTFIMEDAGPTAPSFNEFNPLFLRNRLALQASGVVGGNSIYGDEVVQSGVWGRMSYSVGQFHYQTDGFRKNCDLEENIYNVFLQTTLTHKTSVQAEYRYKDAEKGDLSLLFDRDNFRNNYREKEESKFFRLGFRHAFTPASDLIGSYSYLEHKFDYDYTSVDSSTVDQDGYMAEVQYLLRAESLRITSGIGHFSSDREDVDDWFGFPPMTTDSDTRHTNLYLYTLINYPANATWVLGGSVDFYENTAVDLDSDQFSPKFGVIWNPFPDTTVRAAAFRILKRSLLSDQTIEPTQVAGFNQFFDDGDGADVWRYGIGIDQNISSQLKAGAEFSKRDLEEEGIPFMGFSTQEFDLEEDLFRFYTYWAPHPWLAFSMEYQFERFENPLEFYKDQMTELDTHRISFGINFFHACGLTARLKPTYVDQDGKFVVPLLMPPFIDEVHRDDQFWVVDAAIGYRLPNRWGFIAVEAKNLFDEEMNFQDTDPLNSKIYPEGLIIAKFTVAF